MNIDKKTFAEGLKRIENHFPGNSWTPATISAWFETLADLEVEAFKRGVEVLVRDLDSLPARGNIAAILRRYSGPILTEHTVSDHLLRSVDLARSVDGDPYGYLRKLDPVLCDLADRFGLFNRDNSAESMRFMVRDIARTWIEGRENKKRGFAPPEVAPVSRQIEGPKTLSLEDRTQGREKARAMIARLADKRALKIGGQS
jgi:hypothetical protein